MATGKQIGGKVFSILGVAMLIISIADLPSKLAIWSGWFTALFLYLHPMVVRWLLGSLGVLIALVPWIVEWFKPRISVLLLPTSGNRPQMDLRVTNTGARREFYAQCEFVALRNSPNPLSQITYSLKWESTNSKKLFLEKDESVNLLIARAKRIPGDDFSQMELLGLSGEEVTRYGWAGWSTNSREVLPEYDLKISIFGTGTNRPLERVYTLKPKAFYGPLEMVEREAAVNP
jgi:hypothetical protein